MFCKHKFGKVRKDGYQYCNKCGRALNPVGLCQHEWEKTEQIPIRGTYEIDDAPIGIYWVLTCKRCGDMKSFKVGAG